MFVCTVCCCICADAGPGGFPFDATDLAVMHHSAGKEGGVWVAKFPFAKDSLKLTCHIPEESCPVISIIGNSVCTATSLPCGVHAIIVLPCYSNRPSRQPFPCLRVQCCGEE